MLAGREGLKREVLRLLEEDEEFRLAVAAKLGLLEILRELREYGRRFDEILERMDRREEYIRRIWAKLEEHDRKFNEILEELRGHRKKLEDHDRKFEAILVELREHRKRLEEHDKKFNVILEEIRRIWTKLEEHDKRLSRIEMGLGALAESFYCKALWDDLKEELASRGERILRRRRNARIDGVDIDLLVETDKSIYVVEVKVKPGHPDVGALVAKADLVRSRYPGRRVVAILAGALIGREVEEYARSRGVEVYAY